MRSTLRTVLTPLAVLAPFALTACPDVSSPDTGDNEEEVITTVTLTFTPDAGDAIVAKHADPENDGSPVIDAITLANGTAYTLTVAFTNELEDPAEDITTEVNDESDVHQVLFYGPAVSGPASTVDGALVEQAYSDEDANGFPVGLENTVTAVAAGTADFKVMLRHMPPEDDVAVKNATIAADFAADGSGGIGGDIDADVTFPLTVE